MILHSWRHKNISQICHTCARPLDINCFNVVECPCSACGLWLEGHCPIPNKKRLLPNQDESKFLRRAEQFIDSEWVKALSRDPDEEFDQDPVFDRFYPEAGLTGEDYMNINADDVQESVDLLRRA